MGSTLDGLAAGALVATGSVRRRAQLAGLRPDLTFAGLRGNIDTRLAKADRFDAIVVAAAALRRLGRSDRLAEILEPGVMLPQVGQGALAIECRDDDDRTRAAPRADQPHAVAAGGRRRTGLPGEARAGLRPARSARMRPSTAATGADRRWRRCIATGDGRVVLRHAATRPGDDPDAAGPAASARHLLDGAGGDDAPRGRCPPRLSRPVTVYLVGAGPGDPGLLTVRGAEVLARADVVVHDRLAEASLLDLAPAGAERIGVGKSPGGPVRPGRDQRPARRAGPGRRGGRAAQGRRPLRVRPGRRGGGGAARRRRPVRGRARRDLGGGASPPTPGCR